MSTSSSADARALIKENFIIDVRWRKSGEFALTLD